MHSTILALTLHETLNRSLLSPLDSSCPTIAGTGEVCGQPRLHPARDDGRVFTQLVAQGTVAGEFSSWQQVSLLSEISKHVAFRIESRSRLLCSPLEVHSLLSVGLDVLAAANAFPLSVLPVPLMCLCYRTAR